MAGHQFCCLKIRLSHFKPAQVSAFTSSLDVPFRTVPKWTIQPSYEKRDGF